MPWRFLLEREKARGESCRSLAIARALVEMDVEEEKVEDAIERGAGRGPRIPLTLPLEVLLLLE